MESVGLDKVKLLQAFQNLSYAIVWLQSPRRTCILSTVFLIYSYVDFLKVGVLCSEKYT